MDKRQGEVQRFRLIFFCLTGSKNAIGEPFSLSLISGIEKVWVKGWGKIKIFSRKFFVSQCRKFS